MAEELLVETLQLEDPVEELVLVEELELVQVEEVVLEGLVLE